LINSRRGEAIANRVLRIKKAGEKGVWTADAWWLERQLPEDFGQKPEKKDIKITLEVRDCTQDRDPRIATVADVALVAIEDCIKED
jgi:hypothetical protein